MESPDRPARRGRGAAQGVGAAVHASAPRRGRARWSRPSTRPPLRRGDFTLGPVSLQVDARRADRHHRPQRRRQDDAAAAAARPAARPTTGTRQPRRQRRDRRDRPGPHRAAPRTCRSATRSRRVVPDLAPGRRAHPAREVRAQGRPGRPARSAGSRRASAPAPALALLQARGVNLLVLDEPTNHLDLPAIEQLEQALESYDGALLLVSHDRRLLDNVQPRPALARRGRHRHGPLSRAAGSSWAGLRPRRVARAPLPPRPRRRGGRRPGRGRSWRGSAASGRARRRWRRSRPRRACAAAR